MTGATNDSAEEPCYPDRRAATDARPAGAIPNDMKELLAMLQDIERTLQVERNAGTTDGPTVTLAADRTPPTPSMPPRGLSFITAALVVETGKAREVEPELAQRSGDDIELFLGQLPFGFSYAALAEGLQRLADAPCALVTRMKPGPKPTCAFISVQKEYAPRLASLNKRVLCERNGFWVAPLDSGSDGLAELDVQVTLRATNHVIGLPAHPLVIEPVACKSKVGLKEKAHDGHFAPPVPPSYGQFVGDNAWWPFAPAPPCPSYHPYYNLYGGGAPIAPFAAYPPPLMSMPPAAASLRCAPPFHATMPPLAPMRPLVSVAPHVKQYAKAYAQTRHPAT